MLDQRLRINDLAVAASGENAAKLLNLTVSLQPQLGRTEKLAEDLKQQVKRLAADYKEIAEVLRGV